MALEQSLESEFLRERKRRARDTFHLAYRLHREAIGALDEKSRQGLFRGAVAQYRRSLELFATAEAFTFMGWAYSFLGNLEAAITACQQAITLDPEYGNPYNDIGVYLIEQGSYDQAMGYLNKAISARRYDCHHYAHYNLGRILLVKGRVHDARTQFERALAIDPKYELALLALERLEAR